MCSLIAMINSHDVWQPLLQGMARMEYRGYDSAGIALLHQGDIMCHRAVGSVEQLTQTIEPRVAKGHVGIGHTRWATHGKVSEQNAHPHVSGSFAIVHNGIIENAAHLKGWLEKEQDAPLELRSETDSEIIVHLLHHFRSREASIEDSLCETLALLRGSYAIVMMSRDDEHTVWGARKSMPLVVGVGEGMVAMASDAIALPDSISRLMYLKDDQWMRLGIEDMQLHEHTQSVPLPKTSERVQSYHLGLGAFDHYMQKEIFEQENVLRKVLQELPAHSPSIDWQSLRRLMLVGCGTAYHAGLAASYFFEELAGLVTQCEVASEYRYKSHQGGADVLGILISQSGETADTIAAQQKMKEEQIDSWAIVNVAQSTLAREASHLLQTHAGTEMSVASTKAFTSQLVCLLWLVLQAAAAREGSSCVSAVTQELSQLPALIGDVLSHDSNERHVAQLIHQSPYVLYVGRGVHWVIAAEGALKLKEISYIHAEAYAAGELKHGPLALIEEGVPVIVIAPNDSLFAKTLSNAEEIHARGGDLIFITDEEGARQAQHLTKATVILPTVPPLAAPVVYAIAVQRIAYETALVRGNDIDRPRNLAKSVTVE